MLTMEVYRSKYYSYLFQNRALAPLQIPASLCEGPIFYFYARVSSIPSHSYLLFSWQASCVGERSKHIWHSNIFDYELLLLTIIYMISKLGGETLSPYLSLCSMDAICSKNMLWVVAIMEDYMIVEYVEFAKSKLWHRPFLKIRCIAIVWWLRT